MIYSYLFHEFLGFIYPNMNLFFPLFRKYGQRLEPPYQNRNDLGHLFQFKDLSTHLSRPSIE